MSNRQPRDDPAFLPSQTAVGEREKPTRCDDTRGTAYGPYSASESALSGSAGRTGRSRVTGQARASRAKRPRAQGAPRLISEVTGSTPVRTASVPIERVIGMAQVAMPADELSYGDRIMVHTDILTVRSTTSGVIRKGPKTGVRWVFAYFSDGTMIEFDTDTTWYTTVFE